MPAAQDRIISRAYRRTEREIWLGRTSRHHHPPDNGMAHGPSPAYTICRVTRNSATR